MKKKILFLVNHDIVIYNFRKEIVQKMLSEDYEVIISSPYGERIEDLISMGCKYEEIEINRHGKNPIQEIKLLNRYKKLIKKVSPDLVLTFTIKPNIYGGLAAKKHKVPYVANITGLGTAVENKGLMQLLTKILYKLAFSKITKIFFQNKENMQFFIDNNIAVKTHHLLPGSGVNLQYFEYLKYPTSDITKFTFISRIMKEKGIDQYLAAAKIIKKKYPHTEFHILGFCEEKYQKELEVLHKQGIIVYHGMQRDVRKFYEFSNCIIHPTYYPEGMSNVLLEACASGRPIITTDRSGCREIVDDSLNGYIVQEKSSKNLVSKIESFLILNNEEKKTMGIYGRLKVEKEFNRDIVVNAYLEETYKI